MQEDNFIVNHFSEEKIRLKKLINMIIVYYKKSDSLSLSLFIQFFENFTLIPFNAR